MKKKIITEIEQYNFEDRINRQQSKLNVYKAKLALQQQRRNLQRRLFGEHYNYTKIGLNKEKKYLLQEQKNTEIERSNRILLEKIQRISKRTQPIEDRKRTMTEHSTASDESQNFKPKSFQSVGKSLHQLAKEDVRFHNSSAKSQGKVLYQGTIDQEGSLIPISTMIENNKFIISAQINKMVQKICTSIDSYRAFFRDCLQADHSRITEYLRFNGQLVEFIGIKNQRHTVQEQEQLSLPPISIKSGQTQPEKSARKERGHSQSEDMFV